MGQEALPGPVLEGSDPAWGAAFAWARRQAETFRFDEAAAGPCYEAALPGRRAFCVRDVCHQSTGAHVLGMRAHTKNMLRLFAASISDGKDWCPYWEITRDGRPARVDYESDARFWYNLPGSFDLVDACHRQYLWTRDEDYLNDPVFREFYGRTLGDFIERWDRDGDGIPDHRPADGHRGIATYNEQVPHPLAGGDLLGAMYAALRADAAMRARRGEVGASRASRRRAVALRRRYNAEWWDVSAAAFRGHRRQDGAFSADYGYEGNFLPLYFGLPSGPDRVRAALEAMCTHGAPNVEGLTYIVDILMRWGRVSDGCALLRTIASPGHPRSDYPEVSFCAAGALVEGLAGIRPDREHPVVESLSRLPAPGDWLRVGPVPLFGTRVTVTHVGPDSTCLVNEGQDPVGWRAVFRAAQPTWRVNGRAQVPVRVRRAGEWCWAVTATVRPGEACMVVPGR